MYKNTPSPFCKWSLRQTSEVICLISRKRSVAVQGIESALSTSLITGSWFMGLKKLRCCKELEQGFILSFRFRQALRNCVKSYLLCNWSLTACNSQGGTLWLDVQKIWANIAASKVWGVWFHVFQTGKSEYYPAIIFRGIVSKHKYEEGNLGIKTLTQFRTKYRNPQDICKSFCLMILHYLNSWFSYFPHSLSSFLVLCNQR